MIGTAVAAALSLAAGLIGPGAAPNFAADARPSKHAVVWAVGDGADGSALATRLARRIARDHPDAFGAAAGYEPLAVSGRWAGHIVAFARASADGAPDAAALAAPPCANALSAPPGSVPPRHQARA